MEVGAVKQAFNNEVISLKKILNRAKIQIIHKLTRRAKTLAEKKAPENIKVKFKKKAESAVKEVLIIKKIKARELGKFIVTHTGQLNSYLNKPQIDYNKACARLLLHKCLQEKYRYIRNTFSNTSIEDLLMSRLERRKLKKEARENQKNKKKEKENKVINAEGNWDVENNEEYGISNFPDSNKPFENESALKTDDEVDNSALEKSSDDDTEVENDEIEIIPAIKTTYPNEIEADATSVSSNENVNNNVNKSEQEYIMRVESSVKLSAKEPNKTKHKDVNKNKKFNEKLLKRKFNKVIDEQPMPEKKVVDPFFITSTGESYMSVVEPREPDEIKDIHKQGNRKYRRAVMFGHVPKSKPKRDDFWKEKERFGRQNGNMLHNGYSKFDNRSNSHKEYNNREMENKNLPEIQEKEKIEKLHPSWEAKKRKSGILPFQGKKIVFDEGE